mgnify:CR=1 FL=1
MTEQEELQLFKKYLYIRKNKVNNSGRLSCRQIPKEDFEKFRKIFGISGNAYNRNKGYYLKPKDTGSYIAHIQKGKEIITFTCSNSQKLLFSKYDLPHISNIDDFVVEEVRTCRLPKRKLYNSKGRDFKLIRY